MHIFIPVVIVLALLVGLYLVRRNKANSSTPTTFGNLTSDVASDAKTVETDIATEVKKVV